MKNNQRKYGTKMSNIDKRLDELLSDEIEYLKENDFYQNEHGVFLYVSDNGNHRLSLDFILNDYKEWLIENNKVREL